MMPRITGRGIRETLTQRLDKDATILKELGQILAFGACVASGEPLSLAVAISLIAKTAGSVISSCTGVISWLSDPKTQECSAVLCSYERFHLLLYTTCQRCYLEAVASVLDAAKPEELVAEHKDKSLKPAKSRQIREVIQSRVAAIEDGEIQYSFGLDPVDTKMPLYAVYGEWLLAALSLYGAFGPKCEEIVTKVDRQARKRLHHALSEDKPAARWLRDYLLLEYQAVAPRIASDLAAVRKTLDSWTDPVSAGKERQAGAWKRYREMLQGLLDDKETMYNEDFGVRKVFVVPHIAYHVVGACPPHGEPHEVPDLGSLLGALVSKRVSGEDLIILCGGPGSGKSTLCRALAGELAKNEAVHPVFLKLRRCKEGSDISTFLEDTLTKHGVITRLAELQEVPNLVLILDGFDELVMASRQRLRHFFNTLLDDLRTGPLRTAKAIVSGRDTLFPNGEGLPRASHILALLPFDKRRVVRWGLKWRNAHQDQEGGDFRAEVFYDEKPAGGKVPALHHLVTWPLTLHLVARVHAAGRLDITKRGVEHLQKAYLYRSILVETARRQQEKGIERRLDEKQLREFIRSLAWEMYMRSTDSMDPEEVIPLIRHFYPSATEADLQEIADMAVVNAPELQKGEDTAFEFVHKSFGEYLVAECLARAMEEVAYKIREIDGEVLTWRMSTREAAAHLAPTLGIRLLPAEIQEMTEPMLGCLSAFSRGVSVKDVVSAEDRREGLIRLIFRCQELYADALRGLAFETVYGLAEGKPLMRSPLEAYSNYLAGVCMMGTAAVRQLQGKDGETLLFDGNPFEGAMWRFIWILHAGGMRMDESLSHRLFRGMKAVKRAPEEEIDDWHVPLRLAALTKVTGYGAGLAEAFAAALDVTEILILLSLAGAQPQMHVQHERGEVRFAIAGRECLPMVIDVDTCLRGPMADLSAKLVEAGFLTPGFEKRTPVRAMLGQLRKEITRGGIWSRKDMTQRVSEILVGYVTNAAFLRHGPLPGLVSTAGLLHELSGVTLPHILFSDQDK